MGLCKKILRT